MPVKSLSSSVRTWPDAWEVEGAVRAWSRRIAATHPEVLRVGYFGSYARGDWGVGSDLDLVIVVAHSDQPFISRAAHWPIEELPVPADILVYTREEWERIDPDSRFGRLLREEVRWVFEREKALPEGSSPGTQGSDPQA
ncbi:MAG: nucleotidyltransferase domain-containing protein [Thermoflexus sp.]|jgi:predicted nucleotidyltransferase|nr:nucleotidyltransferase domain-containing protein [Thermoflexus sp.]